MRRVFFLALTGLACSANDGSSGPLPSGPSAGSAPSSGGSGGSGTGMGGSGVAGGLGLSGPGGDTGQTGCASSDPTQDQDADGFTIAQGDCNDCSPHTNPGAMDVPGNGVDEDCSGTPDDELAGCDQGLAIEGDDPTQAAQALGICRRSENDSWGLVSARWVAADGTPGQAYTAECGDIGGGNQPPTVYPHPFSRGLLPKFGNQVTPRAGAAMVALSTGIAREGKNHFSPDGEHLCTRVRSCPGARLPNTQKSC